MTNPQRSAQPPADPSPSSNRPANWLRGTRILVVEDHPDSREVLRLMCESCGASVRVAEEGFEGLAIASEWTPDLILCDLQMPGMDGYTFLRRLREDPRLQAVPAMAVTVLGTDADVKRIRLAGFDCHIVKPIDYELFTGVLERVCWGRRTR